MKHSSPSPLWPTPQSTWLSNIVICFRSRPKSLPKCQVGLSLNKGYEWLDLDFVHFIRDQVRLSVWDDGFIWFRACRASKRGCVYCHSFYAARRTKDPMDLRDALMESLVQVAVPGYAESVWHRVSQPYTQKSEETEQAVDGNPH